ncbi:hypothetical protein [Kribbella shirazensis]|jgi:hypothetical protein|uniref:Uncharacterized protein n=1 Tax=Kribbella shirazensis TaxID=1105143 RepID=A0A7X6A0P2_9ACTN|nr:hypothetical protein [Kribbella shirazensis]NIK56329.1 hypothetical protein [Kribbella shirazensis]
MITVSLTPDLMKAETAYRLERAKRDFRAANRRQRTAKDSQPEPRHALRPRPAA